MNTFFSHFYFPASGQAAVTGVVPSPPRFLPSIFIAHRVQQSHCSSSFHRVLLTHALALSGSQFVHKKYYHPVTMDGKEGRIYTPMVRTFSFRVVHHSALLTRRPLQYSRVMKYQVLQYIILYCSANTIHLFSLDVHNKVA